MLSNLPMFTKPLYNRFKKRIMEGLSEYKGEISVQNTEELAMFLDMPEGKYMYICLNKMQKDGLISYKEVYDTEFWIGLNPFWNAKSKDKIVNKILDINAEMIIF